MILPLAGRTSLQLLLFVSNMEHDELHHTFHVTSFTSDEIKEVPAQSLQIILEPPDFTRNIILFLILSGILGNLNNVGDHRMIPGDGIGPLVQNGIVLDHESATSPQDAFGNFAKFKILASGGTVGIASQRPIKKIILLHNRVGTYLWHRRYFTDDGKVIHPLSEPSQFRRCHLDFLHGLLVHLIESTKAGRPVRAEGVIVHEHPVPAHPLVGIQKGIQLVRISDAHEYGTADARSFQLRLDAAPLPGVAPAVRSSHVTEINDDVRRVLRGCSRLAKFDRIVDADEVPRGVGHHRGTDGVCAIGDPHEGWSSAVEFQWDVAHRGLGAVVVADDGSDEGNWTSGGRCRCREEDEGVGGERRPHHSGGKCCDGG